MEQFFFVGELPEIWKIGVLENRYCACGKRFRECELWQEVFQRAFGGIDVIDAERMVRYRESGTRNRHIPQILFSKSRKRLFIQMDYYLHNLKKLYIAIHEVTNCKVIVDSSKWPAYGRMLAEIPEINMYLIHLIRDARAVVYSWQRQQELQPFTDEPMPRSPLGHLDSTKQWVVGNLATELFWNKDPSYKRLTYEDFVSNPNKSLEQILCMLNICNWTTPVDEHNFVNLQSNHALWGNPTRFQKGNTKIQIDNEWSSKMDKKNKFIVTLLTAPLLYKYGYLP